MGLEAVKPSLWRSENNNTAARRRSAMKAGPSAVGPFARLSRRPVRRFKQHLLVVAIELPDREAAATRTPAGGRRSAKQVGRTGYRMTRVRKMARSPRSGGLTTSTIPFKIRPAGTFARAYGANRRTAIEGIIDADPVAACVQDIMAVRSSGRAVPPMPTVAATTF